MKYRTARHSSRTRIKAFPNDKNHIHPQDKRQVIAMDEALKEAFNPAPKEQG